MIDPANPKRMLAGGSPVSVYRSEDGGESWKKLPDPAHRRARQDAVRLPGDAVRAASAQGRRNLSRCSRSAA